MQYMLMIVQMLQNKLMYIFIERDMAQWLERDALTMLLPAAKKWSTHKIYVSNHA